MASPIQARSQPLHNFSLPHLKWKKNHTTTNQHRGRIGRVADSSPPHQSPSSFDGFQRQSSPSHSSKRLSPTQTHDLSRKQSPLRDSMPRLSPFRDSASKQSPTGDSAHRKSPVIESTTICDSTIGVKTGISASSSVHKVERSKKRALESKSVLNAEKGKQSKIHIPLGKAKSDDVNQTEGQEKVSVGEGEDDELLPKTWNLRPRRPLNKQANTNGNGNGGIPKLGGSSLVENKSQGNKESEVKTVEKKEKKQKFCIPLLREDIEEDVFALTGAKPSRRPKKRPKAVQKDLDNMFPGLWLSSITSESYKVTDVSAKG